MILIQTSDKFKRLTSVKLSKSCSGLTSIISSFSGFNMNVFASYRVVITGDFNCCQERLEHSKHELQEPSKHEPKNQRSVMCLHQCHHYEATDNKELKYIKCVSVS